MDRWSRDSRSSSTYSANKFVFERVGENDVRVAQELVSLSNQVKDIQENEIESSELTASTKECS